MPLRLSDLPRLLGPFFAGLLLLASASAELRPLDGYRVIMWIGDSAHKKPDKFPLFLQRLREMGVNTAMIHHDGDARVFREAGMPFYLENIVNRGLCLKWNSKVRDWDKFVTEWKAERSASALIREYSLDDPLWRETQRKEVARIAAKFAPDRPILLDLRDELSVTISANPFDYDFSPTALSGFRAWLKTQYADLKALNDGWHTDFTSWDEVQPFTTDQIKSRMAGALGPGQDGRGFPRGKPDWQAVQRITFIPAKARENPVAWNLAPWCDHRAYMDLSLARALDDFRQAARRADPGLPVGIEGTQMPAAFGGYDLWRLSQVLDWVEPYDIGNAREIFGSFMAGKPILTTVGEQDARAARRRLWHLLLEGDAGCIIWWSEDCIDWSKDDYPLTPRARALTPVLKEMQTPLARLFQNARREADPIAIHYSQASIQVNWLLESTVDGSTWLRRFSSYEAAHNRMTQRRQAWVKLLQDAGYTPQFLSTAQLERGELEKYRVLVLSDSLAMSDAEIEACRQWAARANANRLLLGSNDVGHFDAHGRMRTGARNTDEPLLRPRQQASWSHTFSEKGSQEAGWNEDIITYLTRRGQLHQETLDFALNPLRESVPLGISVPAEACVRVHRYQAGQARLVAFERNIVWQMGEDLKQKGGNEALQKPIEFTAKLAQPGHIYDLRTGAYAGRTDSIKVALDPWVPSLFAVTEQPVAGDLVEKLSAGQ